MTRKKTAPTLLWLYIIFGLNVFALLFNAAVSWARLYWDKPVHVATLICLAVSLTMVAWCAIDIDRAVHRDEAKEVA